MDSGNEEAIPLELKAALEPDYLLVRWLGAGAFGDVFEARQSSTGQSVAVKVLRAAEAESARRRFQLEMRASAALHHPNIVRVLDAGRNDHRTSSRLYTVFEYVPGETLAHVLRREGMLKVEDAVGVMLQILDALQAAHALGIVHRDLKPSNVMVTRTSAGLHAKVLDFGISAWIQSSREAGARLTQSGERVGTPAYCAPEQLRGEPTTVLVDYYAWGIVALECLTGRHPFGDGTMHEVLHAQFSAAPVPIPKLVADHPLGELLRWAVEKDPSRRASDAEYLSSRLRRLNLQALADGAGYLSHGGEPTSAQGVVSATEVGPLSRARRERRPITALCCRIALGSSLQAGGEEALDEWLDDLRETIVQIAQRNGGRLAGSGGAELLVYFGLEASGEASARRAARAALEIRDHCARRSNLMRARAGWNVDVHFGLHQGMVTVDPRYGEYNWCLSSTAMTASRLSQLATPGDIAASQAAVGLLFSLRRFERQPPDAVLGSTPWYRLSSELSDTDGASGSGALSPFTVGRTLETERLDSVFRDDDWSHRCVVLSGPAGIGKTHLSTDWHRRMAAKGATVLETRCLPETRGNALHPVLELLRDKLGLDVREGERSTSALSRFLAEQGIEHAPNMPLLCAWLGLPQTTWPDPPLSPKKKRDQLLLLMAKLVGRLAPPPSILFIEDIHWADPTTIEWMRLMVDTELDRRPLLLSTFRTETFSEPSERGAVARLSDDGIATLLGTPHTLQIELPPLTDTAARRLLSQVWESEADTTQLVERGAGVPLFLLELVRCGVTDRDFAVPPSIAEVLDMRIEQLGDAKETAQLASVIGPEFDSGLLRELSQRGPDLLGDLNHLQSSGFIAMASAGHYSFTHSLLHESTYNSLPLRDRRRFHAAIASTLGSRYPEVERTKPWLLALHNHYGAQPALALSYGEAAAGQALIRSDNLETLGYVRELKGAAGAASAGWLEDLDDAAERARAELRLLALEATALMLTRGWTDPDLDRSCRRATELFGHVPLSETLQMRYVLAQFYFSSGWSADTTNPDDSRALPHITSLIEAAAESGARPLQALGGMMLAAWQLFQGKPRLGIETARSVERFEDVQDAWRYGYDAFLCARSIEFQARWFCGDPEASEFTAETLRLAEAFGHPATLANVLLYSLTPLQLAGDREGTRRRCEELLSLCERSGIMGFPAYAMIFKGWAAGDPALARGAFEALVGAGQRLCEVYCCTIAAEAELDSGNAAAAGELLERAESLATATGERFALPQVLRLKARRAAARDRAGAERLLSQGIEMAQRQGSLGLRAELEKERASFRRSNAGM